MGPEPRIEDRRVVSLSDEDLMAEAAEGSERAFSELVGRYRSRVLNLVSRLLNDREASDDISQEVFVRVFLHRKNYRRGAKVSTSLFTIAAHVGTTELR